MVVVDAAMEAVVEDKMVGAEALAVVTKVVESMWIIPSGRSFLSKPKTSLRLVITPTGS